MIFSMAVIYPRVVEWGKVFQMNQSLHLHREILALKKLERMYTANTFHNTLALGKHLTNYFIFCCEKGKTWARW